MVRATYKGRAGLPIGQGLIGAEFFDLSNGSGVMGVFLTKWTVVPNFMIT